ncbi:MAG: putative bifunctional diguanylate cyclase/phosphodiesterase [Thiobacillus sp.]
MTTKNKDGFMAVLAADPVQQASLPPERNWTTRGTDRRRRESTLLKDEAAVLTREKIAATREDAAVTRENAADLREDAALLREDAAQVREGEAHTREDAATAREQQIRVEHEILTAAENQLLRVRQANESLVIATMESQNLVDQIQLANSRMDHLVHHDVLTDLPNRTLLLDRLTQGIELARRQGKQLAVMFMDLDHFKHINDSLGHAVGDQLLQSVAKRLRACVRHSDTVSRQGGDEFLLLLPTIEHAEDAAFSAQKMLEVLVPPHTIEHHDLHIGISIGISVYPDDGHDAETLTKCADTAMYYAKESGRNNYKFFEQSMNVRAVQRQSIEASLRRAIERQEFVLHYQPKVNLESSAMVGVEALIRWQHPEHGLLPPAQFVPIAEDCGLILSIGRWVLHEACRQAQAWQQAGLRPITVAVNTSAIEFHDPGFLDNVRTTLQETGLAPGCLELELTESVLMRDAESTNRMLHALAKLGVKLTVDDFGTGYSSLSYLRQFPIDTLKIDQSFVNQAPGNTDNAAIVRAVIAMAKSLRLRVIAEGVETSAHHAFLLKENCDEGQGYHLGRPMEADALASLLQTGLPPHF